MVKNVYYAVATCASITHINSSYKRKRPLQVFLQPGPSNSIAMDTKDLLLHEPYGLKHIILVTDLLSKLIQVSPTSNTTSTHEANVLFDHWVIAYGTSEYLHTDNLPQFVSNIHPHSVRTCRGQTIANEYISYSRDQIDETS